MQVRGRHRGLLVRDCSQPRTGRVAHAGRPDACGVRPHVPAGRTPLRPDDERTPRKRKSGVPDIRRHGVRVRGHAGWRGQLQRTPGQWWTRRLQRGE